MDIQKAIMMDQNDNVATLLSAIEEGNQVQIAVDEQNFTIQAKQAIPYGHKIALKDIEKGREVIKYGEVIGRAKDHIKEGTHVHVHNTESLSAGDL
jgi:altronate dehydratase small subunit